MKRRDDGFVMIVLASKSAARAQMLAAAGVVVALDPADVDERALEASWGNAGPDQVALRLAEAKALAVSRRRPDDVVIGADQTLALGERRFSKPRDMAAARAHLTAFRGRTHHLHAGVAVACGGSIRFAAVSTAAMHVRAFSDAYLDAYLAAMGEAACASVGCYQFEGLGLQLFDRIEGDYHTILGMPLLPLLAHLRDTGEILA
jgi:septum formation protein